jgi:hypothetical protein
MLKGSESEQPPKLPDPPHDESRNQWTHENQCYADPVGLAEDIFQIPVKDAQYRYHCDCYGEKRPTAGTSCRAEVFPLIGNDEWG